MAWGGAGDTDWLGRWCLLWLMTCQLISRNIVMAHCVCDFVDSSSTLTVSRNWYSVVRSLLPSSRHHLSYDDCRSTRGIIELFCAVFCTTVVHTMIRTYMWAVLKAECWFRFSFCAFVYLCCFMYVLHACVGLWLGEVDLMGLKPILRTTTSFSALTLSVGSFDP